MTDEWDVRGHWRYKAKPDGTVDLIWVRPHKRQSQDRIVKRAIMKLLPKNWFITKAEPTDEQQA